MEGWLPVVLLVGVGYGLVLLHRISGQLERLEEKFGDLLAHEGVKGYDPDADLDDPDADLD